MRLILYNIQIFSAWFNFIFLGKKVSKETIEMIEDNYPATKREKKLLERIKNKQLWSKHQ
jgi:hypothetical protein